MDKTSIGLTENVAGLLCYVLDLRLTFLHHIKTLTGRGVAYTSYLQTFDRSLSV